MSRRLKVGAALAAGAVALAALLVTTRLPPGYAAIVALAVGALAYSTLGAVERLSDLYRRR